MINSVMDKTTHGTKLFVRFLRERGIKYIYTEEILRNEYRKYKEKKYSHFLDYMNGNLLKYFDSFFSLSSYAHGIFSHSFLWDGTENGREFWYRTAYEWEWNYRHELLTE